ncbi:hypothetical protein [Shewanella gaetbuli]|uniref:Uncharacterized protein n=1 Tax=Shewanella gaetbuli TaxID=220752 RepID=A0A9X1ZNS2_9GAMM|nr:hypothetical protein [Shewanella gaetbuli]MCL1142972.1 hypothetical protein [Shewanella gaetbuli]
MIFAFTGKVQSDPLTLEQRENFVCTVVEIFAGMAINKRYEGVSLNEVLRDINELGEEVLEGVARDVTLEAYKHTMTTVDSHVEHTKKEFVNKWVVDCYESF